MTDYEVAEYMVSALDGQHHAALLARPGTGVAFDGGEKRWVLESNEMNCAIPYDEIYQSTFSARDQLLATANKYRKKLKQPMINVNTSHNWEEVEDCVQTACSGLEDIAARDKDMSGSLGRLKRAFRSLCRNAGVGQTCASLIPNDSFGFTSVLCGSLKVVFTGLRTLGVYRQEVYRTLEDLPTRMEDLVADLRVYDQDETLHRRAAALYVAVFHILNHVLLWFLKNTLVTSIKALVDPQGFTAKLRDYEADVKMAAQSFESYLHRLSRKAVREVIQLQCSTLYAQSSIQTQLETIKDSTKIIGERSARVEVLERLAPLLNNLLETWQQEPNAGRRAKQSKLLPDVDPENILTHFLYEADLIRNDCTALTRRLSHLSRVNPNVSRIIALQSNPRLRAWLVLDEPSMLLLNGRVEPRPDSEVSLFLAKVIEHLLEQYETQNAQNDLKAVIIPLSFFCGQHRDWQTDSNGSPEELAMSLLLQLVDRGRERLEPAVLRQCYERTKPGSISSICSSLGHLIRSLDPEVVLFVVVDGLRFFTQPSIRSHGIHRVISCLVQIYREQPAATLKFLFASPTRSIFVEELFEEHELLDMPRDIPVTHTKSPGKMRLESKGNMSSIISDDSS